MNLVLIPFLGAFYLSHLVRLEGYSMEPTIHNHETEIELVNYPYEKLKVGDIVDFQNYLNPRTQEHGGGGRTIHRIVRRNFWGGWITKGDNNQFEDLGCVNKHNYLGLVILKWQP